MATGTNFTSMAVWTGPVGISDSHFLHSHSTADYLSISPISNRPSEVPRAPIKMKGAGSYVWK